MIEGAVQVGIENRTQRLPEPEKPKITLDTLDQYIQVDESLEQVGRRVVRYEYPREQLRSLEETIIVQEVTRMLSKHGRIWINMLKDRFSVNPELIAQKKADQCIRMTGEEVQQVFIQGLQKYMKESIIDQLRDVWSQNDIDAWSNLQSLLSRLEIKDNVDLLKYIKKQFKQAIHDYKDISGK